MTVFNVKGTFIPEMVLLLRVPVFIITTVAVTVLFMVRINHMVDMFMNGRLEQNL